MKQRKSKLEKGWAPRLEAFLPLMVPRKLPWVLFSQLPLDRDLSTLEEHPGDPGWRERPTAPHQSRCGPGKEPEGTVSRGSWS